MNQNFKKYKINMFLLSLPVSDYRLSIRLIPQILGISLNTFHNYRNIAMDAKQDIPYSIVVQFELLFEMEPGSLFSGEIKQLPLSGLLKRAFLSNIRKRNNLN